MGGDPLRVQEIKYIYGLILLFVSTSIITTADLSNNSIAIDDAFAVNLIETNDTGNITLVSNTSAVNPTIMNATTASNLIGFEAEPVGFGIVNIDNLTLKNGTYNVTEKNESFEIPFKSVVSVSIKVKEPIDFKKLAEFVQKQGYDVVEQDDMHTVWNFNGSTGNTAYVYNDGRLIIASTEGFNLTTKEILLNDLLRLMYNLKYAGNNVPDRDFAAALKSINYYTEEEGVYHLLRYDFDRDFDLTLSVPQSEIKEAKLKITGEDCCQDSLCLQKAQRYYVDGQLVAECGSFTEQCCNVGDLQITDKIPSGDHLISAESIKKDHTLILETVTTPRAPHMLVLRDNERPIAYETITSENLTALGELIRR